MKPQQTLLPLLFLVLPMAATAATTIFNWDDYDGTAAATGSGLATITVSSPTDPAVSMTITGSHSSGDPVELWADGNGLGVNHIGTDSNSARRNSLDTVNGGTETMKFTISNSSATDRFVTDFTIRRDDQPAAAGMTTNVTGGTVTLLGGTSLGGYTGAFGLLSDDAGGTNTTTDFATTDVSGNGGFPPIGYLVIPAGGNLMFEWTNANVAPFTGVGDNQIAWRSITIIPEPSRAMLLLMAIGAFALRRHRSL